jgi:nitroreductase
MDTMDVLYARRTIRKFTQEPIPKQILTRIVEVARLAPTANNRQPLRFLVIDDPDLCRQVFPCTHWARAIAPEGTPKEGERPTAYILILAEKELETPWIAHDAGATAQTIMVAAQNHRIGTCWMASIDREALASLLNIPGKYRLDTLISMGYPAERSVYEDEQGDVTYYKDEQGTMHIPKRRLEGILWYNQIQEEGNTYEE